MNIRERVQAIGKEMLAGDPTPSEARNNEIILSGLLAHINKAATASEVAYKKKFAELRRTCDSAATAKIEEAANISGSYWLWLAGAPAVAAATSSTGWSSWLRRIQ